MRRWLKIGLAAIAAVVLLAAIGAAFLLYSEKGSAWLLGELQERVPGRLEYRELEGNFASGLTFEQVVYEHEGLEVSAGRLSVAASPSFFPFSVRSAVVEAGDLRIILPEAGGEEAGDELPESLALPMTVQFDRIGINGIEILDSSGEVLFVAERFESTATLSDKLDLHSAVLEIAEGRISAEGTCSLSAPFLADVSGNADLSLVLEEAAEPLEVDAEGRLEGQWGEYVLALQGSAATGQFHLQADGGIDLETGVVGSRLEWSGFSWPMDAEIPQIRSASGTADIGGTLDDWSAAGRAEVSAPAYPPGTISFDANGSRQGLSARIPEAQVLGGSLAGTISYDRSDGGAFETALLLTGIHTEAFYPETPAVVSGELKAQGRLEPLSVEIEIGELETEAFGQRITASGGASYLPGELSFRSFELRSTDSSVLLDGSLDRPGGVAFEADIQSMAQFVPGAAGSLDVRGNLVMQNGRYGLDLELDGQDLAWKGLSLPSVTISGLPTAPEGALLALRAELVAPVYNEISLDLATLDFIFHESRQSLSVLARTEGRELETSLDGRIEDLDLPYRDWFWSGQLSDFGLNSEGQSVLSLISPAEATLSLESVALGPACLLVLDDSRTCVEAAWNSGTDLSMAGELESLPLTVFSFLAGSDIEFSQSVAGNFEFSFEPGSAPSGIVDLRLSPGFIRYTDDPDPILETGDGVVGFRLEDGALTAGNFDVPLPGQGMIDIDFQVPDVSAGLDSALTGRLRVDLDDLDIFSIALPRTDRIQGRLDADLSLSGTPGHPLLMGHIVLADGLLSNESIGLVLSDIQLTGQLTGDRKTVLEGGFRAVEGQGSLEAILDFVDPGSPELELVVRGEGLKLFDAEDLMVIADPDLRFAWKSGAIHIDGRLDIPQALLAPAVIPSATVNESPDLRIVSGELTELETPKRKAPKLEVFGNLLLSLGDRVKLDLPIAETSLGGETRFDWRGGLMPMAQGSFSLGGEVLVFGQLLEITDGNIGFPNVPADNPHLNIQAEREIYGNSEIRRAGVWITGTARRPVVEPYTEPMTTRERAQTLLVTGSDFNMERGTGAVNVGTYIAPKIFVSYGLGVFEDENVISIRYDLGKGWGVMATSGERQTGVDISYTIDQ